MRVILDIGNHYHNDLDDDTGIDINIADKLIAALSICSSTTAADKLPSPLSAREIAALSDC